MKETLEFMGKLQADIDQANSLKVNLKAKIKAIEDQVFELQRQVHVLHAQAIVNQATIVSVTELENELKEAVARGGSLYVETQDAMKKELIVGFPTEDFFWIDSILPKDEE